MIRHPAAALFLGAHLVACSGIPTSDDAGDAHTTSDTSVDANAGDASFDGLDGLAADDASDVGDDASPDAGDGAAGDATTPAAIEFATDLRPERSYRRQTSRVVFRYRSYADTRPASVSAGTTTIDHRLGAGIVRYDRGGAGLAPLLATRFDGTSTGYIASSDLTLTDGITVDAWFRTSTRAMNQTIADAQAFTLAVLPDGRLRGVVRTTGGSDVVVDPTIVTDHRWHHAVLRAHLASGAIETRIYVDSRLTTSRSGPLAGTLSSGGIRPAVGALTPGNRLTTDFFAGEISAVEIHDWAVAHNVIAAPWLDDGSTYMGRPDFHDSFAAVDDIAARIETTAAAHAGVARMRGLYGLPFANDSYVPQGTARSDDPALRSHVFISEYYYAALARDGTQPERNPNFYPTLVVDADLATRRVARIYRLPTYGTASSPGGVQTYKTGGIAVYRGSIYVANASSFVRFPIASATRVGTSAVPNGYEIYEFPASAATTYTTINPGHYLDIDTTTGRAYLGEWVTTGAGRFDRYPLDAAGDAMSVNPEVRLGLPVTLVQGAAVNGAADDALVYLSRADDVRSQIVAWNRTVMDDPSTPGVEGTRALVDLPRGMEDIDADADSSLYFVTENGTRRLQIGSHFPELHPYLYVALAREL